MEMKFTIDEAKSQFFTAPAVEKLHDDSLRGLSRFGSYVRRTARTSLRKARQKKLAEMTKEERQRFRIAVEYAMRENRPTPRRPTMPSKPGEPPRMIGGQIKQFLFFSYDKDARSVVIGPATIDRPTGAPRVLEESGEVTTRNGRVRIEKRPYMQPAFAANISKLPSLLAGGK